METDRSNDDDGDDWTGRDADDHEHRETMSDDVDDDEQWKCVLGERCLVADPFHRSDECFDLEWAEAYFAEAAEADELPAEAAPDRRDLN